MKKLFSLIMGIMMVTCLFTGCENKKEDSTPTQTNSNASKNESSQYTSGIITDGVYKNEYLKLKYTPLTNMKIVDSQKLKEEQENTKKSINQKFKTTECNLEFVAGENSENDSITMIQIISYKLDQDISEDEFVEKTTVQPSSGKTKIGDVEFRKAMDTQSDDTHVVVLVKKLNNYFVVVSLMSDSKEKTNKLLSGFSKLEK